MWKEISECGKRLVESGLVNSVFGNISERAGDKLLIKRRGRAMDRMEKEDVIGVSLEGKDERASVELPVHQEIYKGTDAKAIVHVHSPFAVVEALLEDEKIVPVDSEGKLLLKEIPIVDGESGSVDLGRKLAEALNKEKAAIVKGHGTFAIGKDLDEASMFASIAEYSCRIKYLYEQAVK